MRLPGRNRGQGGWGAPGDSDTYCYYRLYLQRRRESTDVGDTCGNSCEIPSAGSCPALAAELMLPYPRFLQLNSDLSSACESGAVIPQGTSVCMGGTCGD